MTRTTPSDFSRRPALSYAVLFLFAFLFASGSAALAQSPIVFMTSSDGATDFLTRFNNGAQVFSVSATQPSIFQGVTVLNGQLLVADYAEDEIRRFAPNGAYLGPFAQFTNPTFLESDNSDNVYTTRYVIGAPGATRFNVAGAITQTYFDSSMNNSRGVDADAAGNVYVADQNGSVSRIFKFSGDGTFLNSIVVGGELTDIAIDEAGSRLFAAIEDASPNGIRVYDIAGATPSLVGTRPTPADSTPFGISYAADTGNILFTDFGGFSGNSRGLEYSSTGTLLWTYDPTDTSFALDITTMIVPEPTTLSLLNVPLLALIARGRRSRSRT